MMAFRMKVESALRPQILQLQRAGIPTAAAELLLGRIGCRQRSRAFVMSETGSRRRRAVLRRGECLAGGASDERTIEMV
jgi:hypothetical protein